MGALSETKDGGSNVSAPAPDSTTDYSIRAATTTQQTAALTGVGSRTSPYIDVAASKNITAMLGKTAYLNCRVKNLGNKTVSCGLVLLQLNLSNGGEIQM